jgi:CheY-like chemotaxis protein
MEERARQLRTARRQPPRMPDPPEHRRVLVVDPCADTVESTALLLGLRGHEVRGASSGPEALEVARDFRPGTVLMEIRLPGMSGLEVVRRLRRGRRGGRPLLVAVTGYGSRADRRRSLAAGFDLHLVKPVEPELLEALLASGQRVAGGG